MKLEDQVVGKRIPWNKGKHGYNILLRDGGFDAVHKWLFRHFGKADHCEGESCTGKCSMFVWAKRPNKSYEHKLDNFIQLCQSCHMKQDRTAEWTRNNVKAITGKPHKRKKFRQEE